MILSCPECAAKFLIADHLVPSQGRMVRCGACKFQWRALPEAAGSVSETRADFAQMVAETEASSRAQAPNFQLPAIAARKVGTLPLIGACAFLAFAWLTTALYANYANWHQVPLLSSIYGLMGVAPTSGLTFTKATMAREQEGQRTRFVVSGVIGNQSDVSRTIPQVRITLLDAQGEEIASRIYEVNKVVKAGESYPFRITNFSTSFGDRVEEVALDLGHDLQLMFR